MRNLKLPIVLALALGLTACDWLTARQDDDDDGNQAVGAEGKAEPGQVSLKAPGLDVTFTVPKSLTRDVKVHNDIGVLYPKAAITGMYADGGGDKGKDGEVEFRFTSADAPDRILAWYREPSRSTAFKVKKAGLEGAETVISGSQKRDGNKFKLRLRPGPKGGTDGRLVIHSHD
jgi:hypothetical protein